MEGRALAWFQWMSSNGQFTSWPIFLQALQTRFAPSQYEDPTGTLFKLTQKGTVAQYLSEFEDLANRVIGLPAPFLLSCFVSGLAPDIRREVQAHQPLTIIQAAGLARLQEEKLHDPRPHHAFVRLLRRPRPLCRYHRPAFPLLLPCCHLLRAHHPHLQYAALHRRNWPLTARRGFASRVTRSSIVGTGVPLGFTSSLLKRMTKVTLHL